MKRSTLQSQTSEPLIVVEDSNPVQDEEEPEGGNTSRQSSEDESPVMNPYLLSPYSRDIRKHSLPTPQCSGITASQVRRLSERGETVGPGPRQAEFLATLSTAPQPTPGGRRHSVVTISKLPPALFGRNRRESVAAFPTGGGYPGRVLPNRRESIACPPSTEPRGSVHNLQLDIMDDIVQARKVRMKLWNTSSEKVCEVQPLDEASGAGVQRYTNSGRRFSDFVGTTLAPIPSSTKRRASELPQPSPTTSTCTSASASKPPTSGIVCSNTDLISILTSLSTSAMEINQCERDHHPGSTGTTATGGQDTDPKSLQQKRSRLKSNRSNSFDVSILHGTELLSEIVKESKAPANWFTRRHQPREPGKAKEKTKSTSTAATTKDSPKKVVEREPGKVVWDERSGSLVDAHALGSAIEVFLRKSSPDSISTFSSTSAKDSAPGTASKGGATAKVSKTGSGRGKTSWFSKGDDDRDSSTETCDSSLCSTLKDLFVK